MRLLLLAFCGAATLWLYAASVRAAPLEYTSATIRELQAALDSGTVTSEQLVALALARIDAFDDQGPAINAVLHINPRALERARALDEERAAKGARSVLHGIPVLLKDNIDTADMPTTAGSFLLEHSLPPDDATLTRRLREAGAIVLAKLNMSEFASGGAMNSLDGSTYNPHDPTRTPAGSSGGTGAAIAAAYAPLGFGTDTGGSVRNPSSANGVVGLKPTLGLLSRDGIIPLALSFDTAGPMTRSVEDIAAVLGLLTGVDPADERTVASPPHVHDDYTQFLDADALAGARIGVARDFMQQDREVDWVVEAALAAMRNAGAQVVDVTLPPWLLEARGDWYRTIRFREFRAQIADYLGTLGPEYPKSLAEMIAGAQQLWGRAPGGVRPNPGRWRLMLLEDASGELDDYQYRAVRQHALPLIQDMLNGLMEHESLDAIVYPTSPARPPRADRDPRSDGLPGGGESPVTLANLTGFPDLIVPAGFTGRGLPVTISFLGRAWSEPQLLALGYAFEQLGKAHRLPVTTPALPGERIGK